jgi:nitroreductase
MTLLDTIRKRYSCRAYIHKAIEQAKLDQILEAARLAPSAKNLQDWRFIIITDKKRKNEIAKAANNQMFIEKAAVIIAACSNSDYVMRCGQSCGPIDIAIALEHIALQATELGLASCWIGSFYPDQVRKILSIPENIPVIELMALGYPADKAREPQREPLNNIVCYENWNF